MARPDGAPPDLQPGLYRFASQTRAGQAVRFLIELIPLVTYYHLFAKNALPIFEIGRAFL